MQSNPEIKIDANVPLPRRKANRKYPWKEMKPGDSFFVPAPRFASQLSMVRTLYPHMKLTARTVTENGVTGSRVWRVE